MTCILFFMLSCAPQKGSMEIKTWPSGAMVFLDGVSQDITPCTIKKISNGEHELELELTGFRRVKRTIDIYQGDKLTLNIPLEYATGIVHVNTTPPGARVLVDGSPEGTSPLTLNIPLGNHIIDMISENEEYVTKKITVEPDKELEINIDFPVSPKKPAIQWSFATAKTISAPPAADKNRIYFGAEDKFLYAVNEKTGNLLWKKYVDDVISGKPAIAYDTLYCGGGLNRGLYAVDINTGDIKWHFITGKSVYSSPAIAEGVVYFGSYDKYCYAVDAYTGKEKWKFNTGYYVYASPVVKDDMVYTGSMTGTFYALDASSGEELWSFNTEGDEFHSSPVLYKEISYWATIENSWQKIPGYLYALNKETGSLQWKITAEFDEYTMPAADDNGIYYVTKDNYLNAVDNDSGTLIWKIHLEGKQYRSPVINNGNIYLVNNNGIIMCVNAESGEENWKINSEKQIYFQPVLSTNKLYLAAENYLYTYK